MSYIIENKLGVALDRCTYCTNDPLENTTEEIKYNDENIATLTLLQPKCDLSFIYNIGDDGLKYYQFYLYDENNNLLGATNKIYNAGLIVYTVENYNNLKTYNLKLHCLTQSDKVWECLVIIYTNYEQKSVYTDINFNIDKQSATNRVSVNLSQLTGVGENYHYIDNEYVAIANDGYVEFIDKYNSIDEGFVCKLWCKQLSNNIPILKIAKTNSDDYIEIFFVDNAFRAYKHSCNITTMYISNKLDNIDIETSNVYFAVKNYNGRIDMQADIIS